MSASIRVSLSRRRCAYSLYTYIYINIYIYVYLSLRRSLVLSIVQRRATLFEDARFFLACAFVLKNIAQGCSIVIASIFIKSARARAREKMWESMRENERDRAQKR